MRIKKRWSPPIITATVLLFIAVGGSLVYVILTRLTPNPMYSDPEIVESHGPVSLEEAKARCPVPIAFPDSARNIEFSAYYQWLAYSAFVKFEAPADDCVRVAKGLIDQENAKQENRQKQIAGLTPIATPVAKITNTDPLSVPWFDPDTITHGLEAGGDGSHVPKIWIDLDRGVFYYHSED